MHGRAFQYLEVLEALVMLLELANVAPLSMNITKVDEGNEINNAFLQDILNLLCGCDYAPSMTTFSEVDVATLPVVEDMVRIVNSYAIVCDNRNNEAISSPIIGKDKKVRLSH